jgi:hypothetical protein
LQLNAESPYGFEFEALDAALANTLLVLACALSPNSYAPAVPVVLIFQAVKLGLPWDGGTQTAVRGINNSGGGILCDCLVEEENGGNAVT